MSKNRGRRSGSRNKGYFYRTGRGWFSKGKNGRFVALMDEHGERLREKDIPESVVREAHARWLLTRQKEQPRTNSTTVLEVCQAYLAKAKSEGAKKTYDDRADTLYDFCMGVPPRYRKRKDKPPASDRIHAGYGSMLVAKLKPIHIDQWLQSHPNWNGGKRTRIQAVKRSLNYGVESGLIEKNPIRGYRVPRNRGRVTYITPEQETLMYENTNDIFATAIQVMIRTGARPGCEFATVTAAHIRDNDNRMEWTFQPEESKTHRLRVIRIADLDILAIVRRQIERYPGGPIFRNTQGNPWTRHSIGDAFARLRSKLKRKGVDLDKDSCAYSFRHTYAKRALQGFWTDKPTNIETLARLMGNSPQICRDHYLQWCDHYTEPLWEAC